MTFFYQDNGSILKGSKKNFLELTGSQWIDEVIYTGAAEDSGITVCNAIDRQLMGFLTPLYRAYRKKPTKLYIRPGPCKGRHSVHALEKIEKGTVVVEYVGEWLPASSESSSYRWGPIDAIRFRNYSGIVEDGFPNVGAFHLYGVNGVPLRVIFVALQEIAPGEMVTIHYGMNHSVKVQYHSEYNLEAMAAFFMKNPIGKMLKRVKELRARMPKDLGWKRSLELEGLVAKLRYLYETPGALMLLLSRGVIKAEEVFHYYDEAEFRYFLLGFPLNPNARQREVISYLGLIRLAFNSGLAADVLSVDLLDHIRHRVFFSAYLKPVLTRISHAISCEGGQDDASAFPSIARDEAFLWNEAFDALWKGDRLSLEVKFAQVRKRVELIQACLAYAAELRSPLLPWLQSLGEPILPLRPTG